jgi:hypothetical protein
LGGFHFKTDWQANRRTAVLQHKKDLHFAGLFRWYLSDIIVKRFAEKKVLRLKNSEIVFHFNFTNHVSERLPHRKISNVRNSAIHE